MKTQVEKDPYIRMLGLSLVICRNKEGKYLGVKENNNKGWWLPGGKVDLPETFFDAALREAKEEAGIDIELKGILRIEYNIHGFGDNIYDAKFNVHNEKYKMIKIIFYAEPKDDNQKPKSVADNHTEEARWLTLEEIKELESVPSGWRGAELYDWGKYLDEGGTIFPLSVFAVEGSDIQFISQAK